MDDKNSDWKEFNLPTPSHAQETELDKIIEEHLVNDAVSSHSEDVHHSSSDSEGSVHDTVTSVLYIPHGGTQQPESSPQSPVPSPRPVLTSQQSIVSGRFTRTSYASGDTGHVSTPTRLSPLPINMISPDTLEDKDENQDAPLGYGSSDSSVGDSTEYVESAQRTVTSLGAISTDTQDSARYDDAPFPCGNIHFWIGKMNMEESSTKKHYVTVSAETPSEEVTRFMGTYWKMRSPKIVLSVISGVKHFRPWKNNRLKEQFQKGITKAANTTEMWIITDGVDMAVSKMIGEAIQEERARRECKQLQLSHLGQEKVQRFQKLTLIGVVPKNVITYSDLFQGNEMGINIKNEGIRPNSDLYELNPDHTHFIFVDEEDRDRMFFTNIRCQLEQQFQYGVGRKRRLRRLFSWGSDEQYDLSEPVIKKTVPVVGLLVQGSPRGVDHVLTYLTNKMPVVLLKGSGGVADLLAYAFEELLERSDPDFEEHFLKPELTRMICKVYPEDFKENDMARTEFRDKILQCCHLAIEDEQVFLTMVNTQGWDANLKDLDKYLLKALFNCERQTKMKWREKVFKDLQLILDWNRPDMALSMIFHRDDWGKIKVDKKLFEQALLKLNREEFVEIFLDHGFLIHKYLNHKKYKLLYEKADDREFFVSICQEKVLGQMGVFDQALDANFLVNDLNRLIFKLIGLSDFVQPYEMSMNSVGLYVLDPAVAERKALNWLTVWAVLMNRHKLAKVLWNRCDEPIALALICSNLYKELAKNCVELFLRTEMERNAKEFGDKALGVLDIGYMDSSEQTYSMLSAPLKDFNNKTSIEIAHDAGYIGFIAHPCCQKWLTRKLFGAIQVKELDLGFLTLPNWFKILVSVFFIFPIYIWIGFVPKASSWKKRRGITFQVDSDSKMVDNDISDSDDEEEDENLPTSKSLLQNELERFKKRKKLTVRRRLQSAFQKQVEKEIPLWKKIYLLWSAPITTFWVTQTMYFCFLGLFCLAVLWPTCGNFFLDLTLWLWTSIILIDLVQRTYTKHIRHKAVNLLGPLCEIILVMFFLIMYLVLRIIPHWFNSADIITSKVVLSIALIFFFYRLLGIYLPISPTLGPMLVRMNRMIKYDFVDFIRMFLVFMISGGVTIQAILYPNYPLGIDLVKRVLTRPLFAMFLTQIADLDGDTSCSGHYNNVSIGFCTADVNFRGSHYANPESVILPIQKCPYSSLFGYLITIQYLLICKLVLVTLLFAMFALTITKVDNEASEIWKFQRYALIIDFEERLNLPPPFIIISYICILLKKIYNKMKGCKRNCCTFCCCSKKAKPDEEMSHRVKKNRRSEDYNYWKKCSIEYLRTQEFEEKKERLAALHNEIIVNLQEDMRLQKKNLKRMSDRIVELERTQGTSRMYLEHIYHKLEQQDVHGMANRKGQIIHVAARQSPYPGTSIARFPVFDKYVPWETLYDVYDPKIYTLPIEKFPDEEKNYVDVDIIELKKLKEERAAMMEEELIGLPVLPPIPHMKWNAILTVFHQHKGSTQVIDRRSWISRDDQPCRYRLDPNGLPLNPMGRTGIRGKGTLWRWGPNHLIKAVCTRWRRKYNQENQPSDYLYVEGKRVLEFIATQREGNNLETVYELPGGVLHGLTSPYSVVRESFLRDVFDETEPEPKTTLDQGDMIQFFAQFATQNVGKTSLSLASPEQSFSHILTSHSGVSGSHTSSRTSLRTEPDSQGFSASLLYKGYLDDPRNTDNAWMEAEVWNFHYDIGDNFELRMSEENGTTWKEVLPNVKLFGNDGAIIQEAAKIHDAYC